MTRTESVPHARLAIGPSAMGLGSKPLTVLAQQETPPAQRTTSAPSGAPAPNPSAAVATCITRDLAAPPRPLRLSMLLGRSLFPLITLALILGTLWWGPWGTLALALVTWHFVGRHG